MIPTGEMPSGDLDSLLGHNARLLWDVQKVRVMGVNRLKAMQRDGLPPERLSIHSETVQMYKAQEVAVNRNLRRLGKAHVMADWIAECPGLDYGGFGRIVGVTGSFLRFPTVSKVWKYMGLSVENGRAARRHKGEVAGFAPKGQVVAYQISGAIVRLGRGRYWQRYREKKDYYIDARPDWSPLQIDRAARRYAFKMLIKDMWVEWHGKARLDG